MKSILKKILGRSAKRKVRYLLVTLRMKWLDFFSSAKFLSNFYYFFLSSEFSREHQVVLKARSEYIKNNLLPKRTSAFLRRNVHRIEKGLIMRPRREVFAEGLIGETVDMLERVSKIENFSQDEKQWAAGVLQEYFSVVTYTPKIKLAKRNFDKIALTSHDVVNTQEQNTSDIEIDVGVIEDCKPYLYNRLEKAQIGFETLEKLYYQRRSVRWFKNESVPLSKLQKAANSASLAPSACNRQSFSFLVSTDKRKAEAVAGCAGGTAGFAHNIPSIIAVVGDLSAYPSERDRHLIYIDSSLATMQLLLALETLGLSSCVLNWPDIEKAEQAIMKHLDIPPFSKIIMLIAVGYADDDGGIPFSQKKQDYDILQEVL